MWLYSWIGYFFRFFVGGMIVFYFFLGIEENYFENYIEENIYLK